MSSIPHSTHGVNGPGTSVSDLSETTLFDSWANADLRNVQRNGHYYVTEYSPAFRAWVVLNPVQGYEYARTDTCSCLGHGAHAGQVCEHMRAVRAYLDAMWAPEGDDHDGYMTMGGPL